MEPPEAINKGGERGETKGEDREGGRDRMFAKGAKKQSAAQMARRRGMERKDSGVW